MKKQALNFCLVTILLLSCTKKDETTATPTPVAITNTGTYTLDGQVFNGKVFTDNVGMVWIKDNNNSNNTFTIDRMPSNTSGTFTIGKNFTGNTILPMGYLLESRSTYSGYGSESGTITKTAARDFTFQCILYNPTKTAKYQISGSGKY
ncbi:MAG: hypothetical protein ABL929_03460 [Ferruginibacter sp.]|nr:hypothetical protein [Ferruginibacter sp.]